MAVRRLIALLCIFYCLHGLCEAQEEQARMYKDKNGKMVYHYALRCQIKAGSIMYQIPDDYSKVFDQYTKREKTTCCYGKMTRNDCCIDFEKDDKGGHTSICKCAPEIPCGSLVCPDGWKIIDKVCYKVEEGQKAFAEAIKGCQDIKGKLMEQKDTKLIVAGLLKDSKAAELWIGAKRIASEDNFKFLVDKVEKNELHKNFKPPVGGPKQTDECVSMAKNSEWKWKSNDCKVKKGYYICEKEATVSE